VLESLSPVAAEVAAAEQTWNAFREQPNLDQCAFLALDEEAQRQVFAAVRGASVRKASVENAWRAARNRVSAEYGNRPFRAG
jgi:hypothetical protein